MMNDYQDFEVVEAAIDLRAQKIESERVRTELVHSAWNILKMVGCKDHTTFETVINGIVNSYYAGYDEVKFEERMYDFEC